MRTVTLWLLLLWGLCGAHAQHPRLRRPEPLSLMERDDGPQMSALLDRLQGFYTVYGRGRKRHQVSPEEENSEYLKGLQDLYTTTGRGRKRQQATPDEGTDLLKGLREFYTATGRGRFGKRQMHIADASVVYNEMPLFDKISEDPLWKNLARI